MFGMIRPYSQFRLSRFFPACRGSIPVGPACLTSGEEELVWTRV